MDELTNALSQKVGHCIRNLKVTLEEGQVILEGTTKKYYHKQIAQEGVKSLAVGRVINRIKVT